MKPISILETRPGDVAASIHRTPWGTLKLQIDTGLNLGPYKREFNDLADIFTECGHLFPRGQRARFKAALRKSPDGVANTDAIARRPADPTPPKTLNDY